MDRGRIWLNIENQYRIEPAIDKLLASGYQQLDEALIIPALFILSLIMLPGLIKYIRRYLRSSQVKLNLDPYPGQIGGSVGGDLILPISFEPNMQCLVQVNCIKVTYSRSGKNTRRWESVHYRETAETQISPVGNGSMLRFQTRIDSGQPESAIEEKGSHRYS